MNLIAQFIHVLAHAAVPDDAHNEYAGESANARIRRENLALYLNQMLQRQPAAFMLMEAPGYRGCRLTGVPVTSRKILLEGVPTIDMFGEANGYQPTDDAGFENVYGEQSATIVWATLRDLGIVPVIWNSYPFHPHKPGQPRTNRKPRQPELTHGAVFVARIIALMKPQTIIAVGNVADGVLKGLQVECTRVRHPAQGGKHDFVAGMTAILRP